MIITIQGERAPSWNGFYAGMHYRKRAVIAERIHLLVKASIELDTIPFDVPVDISVVATYRRNPPDSDNVVAKVFIDGLKTHVIHDDNGRWVRRVTTEAVKGKEDSVTIEVTPAN